MEQEIRGHSLHPSCTLVLNADGDAFKCGACKRGSSDTIRYRCGSGCCDEPDFHGQCVMSPDSLEFWGHPHHPLTLVRSGPDLVSAITQSTKPEIVQALVESSPAAADGRIPVYCDMCTNEVEGMHYQCAPCGVFLHPVCVQLPTKVSSAAHTKHELTLICCWPNMCMACGTPGIWEYRCFLCFRRYHVNCIPEFRPLLGYPYSTGGSNSGPDRTRRFGAILLPKPPPPPKMMVDQRDPFAGMNPLGMMDPFNMPRRGPSTAHSVLPDPSGGAFPFSGEYGRSTFGQ